MQQVIYLEVEDDMPAIRELLEGAQARQVLLVIPKGSDTLHNTINLRVLRRCAVNLGLDIGLVTRDSRTRQLAREEGLAVLSSIGRGRRRGWRGGTPRRSSAQRAAGARVDSLQRGRGDVGYGDTAIMWAGRILGVLLFIILFLVVAAVAVLVVPEAKVTVTPYRQPIEVSLELRADPEAEKADREQLIIPARVIEAQVEQTGEIATESKMDAPDTPAAGTVIFINQTSQAIQIDAGVIVRTSTGTTVRFTTVTAATLAASVGATAEVEIAALEPGPVGNVAAATITTVETPELRAKVRVTNERPTKGGGLKQVGYVTQADMDRLKAQLLQQLQDRAYAELLNQLGEHEFLPEESLTTEILAEVYDQFLGTEAGILKLQMRILASGTAVDRANANLLAYEALKEQVPGGYELRSEDMTFSLDEKQVRMDGRSVLVPAKAVAYLVTQIDRGQVRSAVVGLTAEEAMQVLAASFSLDGPPAVEIQPDWIKRWKWLNRVPWLPFRIQVVVLD